MLLEWHTVSHPITAHRAHHLKQSQNVSKTHEMTWWDKKERSETVLWKRRASPPQWQTVRKALVFLSENPEKTNPRGAESDKIWSLGFPEAETEIMSANSCLCIQIWWSDVNCHVFLPSNESNVQYLLAHQFCFHAASLGKFLAL